MDRLTAFFMAFMVLALVGVVAYISILQPQAAPAGPATVTVQPVKVTTDHWKVRVYLKEGIGPNSGMYIDGTVTAYATKIEDVYDIPNDAIVLASDSTTNGTVLFDIAVDPDFMTENGMPVYFVAEATDYYKNMVEVVIPKEAVPDEIDREHAVTIKLDKVATLGWSADEAYRGSDSPVLRYKSADEVYKTVFTIKPTIDFQTDKVSGVFIVKKVTVKANDSADMTNVDRIDAVIGNVEFEDISAADLPESERLDEPVTVTADNPVNVEILVYTTDGTASLTSGNELIDIVLEDVLGNTHTVTVKVA